MIDHLEIPTGDIARAAAFYARVLAPLGYSLTVDGVTKGFSDGSGPDFFLVEGLASNAPHFAFQAKDRASVQACFNLGEEAGGRQDRPPALAPQIHAHYFAGYVRDPDGRLVEFVCHAPDERGSAMR
jgi:catechol 2,3-dioxygenase-like lactoylglutathione lyase family enzyme